MKRYRIIALIYIVLLFGGLLGSLTLAGHYFADFTSAEGCIGAKTEAALRQNLPLRDALKQWKITLLILGGVAVFIFFERCWAACRKRTASTSPARGSSKT